MNKNKIPGSLIKYHRERKDISQKELCYGICVVSHLSKIENNKVDASPEIVKALFNKLEMEYYDSPNFLNRQGKLIDNFFRNSNFQRSNSSTIEKIRKEKKKLLSSPLIISYLLVEEIYKPGLKSINLLSQLAEYMSENEIGWYYNLKARTAEMSHDEKHNLLLKSYGLLRNSFSILELMSFRLSTGNFQSLIEIYPEAISIALKEGNLMGLVFANLYMGNCYAAQGIPNMMIPYYETAKNLLWKTENKDLVSTIEYNIGATYFEIEEYEKALEYLLISKNEESTDSQSAFLACHKLALTYIKLHELEKAENYIKKAKTLIEKSNLNKIHYMMIDVTEMQLAPNYLDNPIYGKMLEELCEELEKGYSKGFYLFNKRFLEEWYCYQRQYKKAYLLYKK